MKILALEFANIYFEGFNANKLRLSQKLSLKVLLVKPGSRLSCQYRHRRAETWEEIYDPVRRVNCFDNKEGEIINYQKGEIIILTK